MLAGIGLCGVECAPRHTHAAHTDTRTTHTRTAPQFLAFRLEELQTDVAGLRSELEATRGERAELTASLQVHHEGACVCEGGREGLVAR
jgi:hypothetical protein